MARPTLKTNPKFALLVKRLAMIGCAMPNALARGLLEWMWEAGYECGNPTFKSPSHFEASAGWDGEPGILTQLFTDQETNFLDRHEDGSLTIHDFWDHAPDYVRKRAQREADRQAKGKSLSEVRAEAGRAGGSVRWQTDGKRKQIAITPAPAPAPTQVYIADQRQTEANSSHLPSFATETPGNALAALDDPGAAREADRPACEEPEALAVEEIYRAYPRHEAKAKALESIRHAMIEVPAEKLLAAVKAYRELKRNVKREYIPYAATWFAERRYLDAPDPPPPREDGTAKAIAAGEELFASGAPYADVMSRLSDQFGDQTAFKAARQKGWKR